MARTVLLAWGMVYAISVSCRVEAKEWLSPTTLRLVFTPSTKFDFQPGQFIAVVVPGKVSIKRCYSLSNAPEEARASGYELCVKVVPGGRGSAFLASLHVGDTFKAFAPYGHFTLKSKPSRNVVFIATATGIGPFRSMVRSVAFKGFGKVSFIAGHRTEDEILYKGELEKTGIDVVRAVSQPQPGFMGFRGRVTDYLRQLPATWHWHNTDFYICGNAEMIVEVEMILRSGHGVSGANIYRELFTQNRQEPNVIAIARPPKQRSLFPVGLFKRRAKG